MDEVEGVEDIDTLRQKKDRFRDDLKSALAELDAVKAELIAVMAELQRERENVARLGDERDRAIRAHHAEKARREQVADNYLQSVSRWNTEKARLRDHIANAGRRAEQAEAERDEAYADIDRLHAEIARLRGEIDGLRWVIARACEIGGANCAQIVKEAHNRA